MTGLWIITGCLIVVVVALLIWTMVLYAASSEASWATGICAMVVGVVGFVFVAITISAYVDRAGCSSWQTETGRESKFVFYTPVTWACLAKTQDGTWLPKEQLREFGEDAG